jgi:hypothetical protein
VAEPATKRKVNWILIGVCLVLALVLTGIDPVGDALENIAGDKAMWIVNGALILVIIWAFFWDRKRGAS